MPTDPRAAAPDSPFLALKALVERSGLSFCLHEHQPARTMDDAAHSLAFEVARIVKTIAFRTRDGRLVLAALLGPQRVDYARLAALCGVSRRDLSALSPQEVLEELGVAPGSVSPLPLRADVLVFVDGEVLGAGPTVYCGLGRPDRTLELAPADLLLLSGGRTGSFSR